MRVEVSTQSGHPGCAGPYWEKRTVYAFVEQRPQLDQKDLLQKAQLLTVAVAHACRGQCTRAHAGQC